MYMYRLINRLRIVAFLPTALLAVVLGISALTAQPVRAEIFDGAKNELNTLETNAIGTPTTSASLDTTIGKTITALLSLVGVIFFVLMVYGGYLWMTARGEKDQVDKAKQTIIAACIGIAITLAAYAISAFVVEKLVTAGGL